jgi:hypothetical protein
MGSDGAAFATTLEGAAFAKAVDGAAFATTLSGTGRGASAKLGAGHRR